MSGYEIFAALPHDHWMKALHLILFAPAGIVLVLVLLKDIVTKAKRFWPVATCMLLLVAHGLYIGLMPTFFSPDVAWYAPTDEAAQDLPALPSSNSTSRN